MNEKGLRELFVEAYGPEVSQSWGTNIKVKCPQCSKNSLACEIVKGLRFCYHCGYGKGLPPLQGKPSAEALPDVDTSLQLEILKKLLEISDLDPSHVEYLNKRGISRPDLYQLKTVPMQADRQLLKFFSVKDLINSGWCNPSDDPKGYSLGSALKARRIIIPHWQGDKFITCKTRIRPYVDPEEVNELRYSSPRGSNVGRNLWWKDKLQSDAIITEGELCAMAMNQSGIRACGLPGLRAAESPLIINQIKELTANSKRVFIILDTDSGIANDPEKLRCSTTLRKSLGNESAILYLPQLKKEQGMDLDLFLNWNDVDYLQELMEDAWIKRDATYRGILLRIRKLNGQKHL